MRKCILGFLIMHAVAFGAIAQIRTVDQTDKQPIAFVRFITEDGKLAASSDINGVVDTTFLAQKIINGLKLLSISHASFETKELKGFFRSYLLEEDIPKFYTDGICEYYLTADGKTVGVKLLEYRTFRNEELLKKEKKEGFIVKFRVNSVPSLPKGMQFKDRLGKNYTFSTTAGGIDVYRAKAKAGTIRLISENDGIQTSINHLAPKTMKRYSLLGLNFKTTQEDRSQCYHSTKLNDLRYELLDYHTDIIQFSFNYPKEPEIHSTAIHEFYSYDIRIVPKSDLKDVEFDGSSLRYSHSYSSPYWEALSEHHIPALSQNIADALGKTLTPY